MTPVFETSDVRDSDDELYEYVNGPDERGVLPRAIISNHPPKAEGESR